MHISINNFLPSVNLHIGTSEDDEIPMRILADTEADMNTGNSQYHLWVMYHCSEMVDKYL